MGFHADSRVFMPVHVFLAEVFIMAVCVELGVALRFATLVLSCFRWARSLDGPGLSTCTHANMYM